MSASWTPQLQADAMNQLNGFVAEYVKAMENWKSAAAAGNSGQGQAQMDDVLRRWRDFTEKLQSGSIMLASGGNITERMSEKLKEVHELRESLEDLQKRLITGERQATSVDPKVTASPYVNILGLQRTFREPTRNALLAASIVIGFVALLVLGAVIYFFVTGSGLASLISKDVPGATAAFSTFTMPYRAGGSSI
jgi:hypothetical protein